MSFVSWRWDTRLLSQSQGSVVIRSEQGWFRFGWTGVLWFYCPRAPVSSSVEELSASNHCLTLVPPQKATRLTLPPGPPLLSWLL